MTLARVTNISSILFGVSIVGIVLSIFFIEDPSTRDSSWIILAFGGVGGVSGFIFLFSLFVSIINKFRRK